MSPRKTRRGTVRASVSEVSIDSSLKKSATKSTRKTRQANKSQNAKNSEDSDALSELSTANAVSEMTRSTRKKKIDENQTLGESRSSRAKRNDSKANESKRKTKGRKEQVSEANSASSEDERVDTRKKSKASKKAVISKSPTPTKKVSSGKVTPESSPIIAPPNPHRSTKTPKKSPSNIGSPKTHSRVMLRSLNVPRKLPIESPSSSDQSNDLILDQSISSKLDKSIEKSKNNLKIRVSLDKMKATSPKLNAKSRFCKSPEVALRSPNSKTAVSSKKSPSKKIYSNIEASVKVNLSTSLDLSTSHENKSLSKSEKKSPITQHAANKSANTSKTSSPKKSNESPKNSSNLSLKTPSKSPSGNPTPKSKNTSKSKKTPKNDLSFFVPNKTPKIALSLKSHVTPSQFFNLKKSSPKKEKKSSSKKEKKEKTSSPKEEKKSSSKKHSRKSIEKIISSLDVSMSPKVVVERLSIAEYFSPNHKAKQINSSKSPQSKSRPSLVVNKVKTVVPKLQTSAAKKSITGQNNTPNPVNKRLSLLKPLTSSTPREKVKLKKLISPTNVKSKISKKLNNRSNSAIANRLLDDVSEPSFNDSSLMPLSAVFDTDTSLGEMIFGADKSQSNNRMNNSRRKSNDSRKSNNKSVTFEIDSPEDKLGNSSNNKTKKDGTYEVENPKTPRFQNKSIKRKLTETNDVSVNDGPATKRSNKVQFATPASRTRGGSVGINRLGTPGHAIQKNRTPLIANRFSTSMTNKSFGDKEGNKSRVNSVVKSQIGNGSVSKRLSTSQAGNSTVKSTKASRLAEKSRISKLNLAAKMEKKMSLKTPAKKVPNFGSIHKKQLSTMESVVDRKKRIEERHKNAFNAPTSSKKLSPSKRTNGPCPSDMTDGKHNRYGWAVRKEEAVKMVSKKQAGKVESNVQRRQEARSDLKGVRMNKRFKLLMGLRGLDTGDK